MYWDSYDCEIQCEEFYEEPFECPDDFYDDMSMDDYDQELCSEDRIYALVV